MKAWDNYKHATPVIWRKIGDAILALSMSISGAIMGLPITDNQKIWSLFVINLVGGVGKFLTNLFKIEETSQDISSSADTQKHE